jgi:hypothetical protein
LGEGRRREFFFPFVRFKLRGKRLNEGATEIGHGVYSKGNCTTPADKKISNKLPDAMINLNDSFLH